MTHLRTMLCALFIGALSLNTFAPLALAAEEAPAISITQQTDVPVRGDFQVGPSRFVVELEPGEEKTIELQVTSREGEPSSYAITAEDLAPKNGSSDSFEFFGGKDGPFSARSWFSPAVKTLSMKHGQRAFVPVKIKVPQDAAAGDHYAVVLFERKNDNMDDGAVRVLARVGVVILITVKGDIVEAGNLTDFTTSLPFYWKFPVGFSLSYENRGTVHLTPKGKIIIKNVFGIIVDEIPLKDLYILRESSRIRELFWKPKFALGRYTATLETQSRSMPPETMSVSFWALPIIPVSIGVVIIFLLSFAVQFFTSRFEIRKKS